MKKDLLKLLDLSSQDILTILDTADQLKAMKKSGHPAPLPGRENPSHDLREELHPHPGLL